MTTESTTPPSIPATPTIDVEAIKREVASTLQESLSKQYESKLDSAVAELRSKQEKAAAVLRGEDISDTKTKSAFAQALAADPEKAMLGLLSSFESAFESKLVGKQTESKNNVDAVNAVFQEVEAEYDLPKVALKHFPSLMHSHFVVGQKPIKEAARAALNELIADFKIEKRSSQPGPSLPGAGGVFAKTTEKQSVADYIKLQNEKLRKTRKV
jgi:hypothetical protein